MKIGDIVKYRYKNEYGNNAGVITNASLYLGEDIEECGILMYTVCFESGAIVEFFARAMKEDFRLVEK